MFGFGTRMDEARYFYERFPEWSKMGKMVTDVHACTDALETIDFIDSKNIFLMGNTIGGSVALIAAAQDKRIKGVAVVSAFSPFRSSNKQYETLRTYSHQHGFLPSLGWYVNTPQQVPLDFGEIISCIAPRPLMVISPTLDWHADAGEVTNTMKSVATVYSLFGQSNQLNFQTPLEINRMTPEMEKDILDFFSKNQ
jgi:pimeloyl-ACP methyl ester carboxylesterase